MCVCVSTTCNRFCFGYQQTHTHSFTKKINHFYSKHCRLVGYHTHMHTGHTHKSKTEEAKNESISFGDLFQPKMIMNFWPWRDMKRRLHLSQYKMRMIQFFRQKKNREKQRWDMKQSQWVPNGRENNDFIQIATAQVHHRTIYVVSSASYPSKCSFLFSFFSLLVCICLFCKEQ